MTRIKQNLWNSMRRIKKSSWNNTARRRKQMRKHAVKNRVSSLKRLKNKINNWRNYRSKWIIMRKSMKKLCNYSILSTKMYWTNLRNQQGKILRNSWTNTAMNKHNLKNNMTKRKRIRRKHWRKNITKKRVSLMKRLKKKINNWINYRSKLMQRRKSTLKLSNSVKMKRIYWVLMEKNNKVSNHKCLRNARRKLRGSNKKNKNWTSRWMNFKTK